jgi:hypothetical protein
MSQFDRYLGLPRAGSGLPPGSYVLLTVKEPDSYEIRSYAVGNQPVTLSRMVKRKYATFTELWKNRGAVFKDIQPRQPAVDVQAVAQWRAIIMVENARARGKGLL